ERHALVWGGGYRVTDDRFVNNLNPFVLVPEDERVSIGNIFVQDSIALGDSLTATLGTKLEYSSYTGLDYLPSGRLAWKVSETDMLWAAFRGQCARPRASTATLRFPVSSTRPPISKPRS